MTKIILIDDEPLAINMVEDYLAEFPDMQVVATCGDGFEAAKAIMRLQPDLIFLDVQMPKISGFELLDLLDEKPHTIFTTAFDEYAVRAFEQHAIDYLLKPISQDRFRAAIQKFRAQNLHPPAPKDWSSLDNSPALERVIVKNGTRISIIRTDEVVYFQADDDYVSIYTAASQYLKKGTLASFEERLDPKIFVRIHRSYIANIDYLARIETYEKDSYVAIMQTGAKIPVSKSGYSRLKVLLDI